MCVCSVTTADSVHMAQLDWFLSANRTDDENMILCKNKTFLIWIISAIKWSKSQQASRIRSLLSLTREKFRYMLGKKQAQTHWEMFRVMLFDKVRFSISSNEIGPTGDKSMAKKPKHWNQMWADAGSHKHFKTLNGLEHWNTWEKLDEKDVCTRTLT